MSNVHPAEERYARLYLHLAERFGWTPEQVGALDPSIRQAMAKVLNLPPRDDAPTEDEKQPAEDVTVAEWERELLAAQATATTHGASNGMTFGEALNHLNRGERVYRTGWNGKGMWLDFEDTTRWPLSKMQPFIYMHTADGSLVPWVASQTDILATDWLIRVERLT